MDEVSRNYGEYAWGRILNRYSSFPIFGFKNAFKSITGVNVNNVYDNIKTDFEKQEYFNIINQKYKVWFDTDLIEGQYSPRWIDKENILYYQKGISQTQKLIRVNRKGETEELLNRKLANIDNSFTVNDSIIYTSEQHNALRYTATKYSDNS